MVQSKILTSFISVLDFFFFILTLKTSPLILSCVKPIGHLVIPAATSLAAECLTACRLLHGAPRQFRSNLVPSYAMFRIQILMKWLYGNARAVLCIDSTRALHLLIPTTSHDPILPLADTAVYVASSSRNIVCIRCNRQTTRWRVTMGREGGRGQFLVSGGQNANGAEVALSDRDDATAQLLFYRHACVLWWRLGSS